MAFWKYDLFPYVVAGEIDGFDSSGSAIWKGTGYSIHRQSIIAIVPYKDGLRYQKKLEHWKEKYKKDIEKVKRNCIEAMVVDIPVLKNHLS
jgi:hypothetical protein